MELNPDHPIIQKLHERFKPTAMMLRWATRLNCYLNWRWWRKARRLADPFGSIASLGFAAKSGETSRPMTAVNRRNSQGENAMPEEQKIKPSTKLSSIMKSSTQSGLRTGKTRWAGKMRQERSKAECLAYIKEVMDRYASIVLRKKMQEQGLQ